MAKRFFAITLALILIAATFSACSSSSTEPEETTAAPTQQSEVIAEDNNTFKLSYTQADSLNPFDAVTQNNQVLDKLVFESLFNLDDNFKSSLNIASSYNYSDSTTLNVVITSGLTFSNGSVITADDIERSFDNAKKSEYWGNTLSGIKSCRADSSNSVVFDLEYPNAYAQNLLTFPIVCNDEDSNGYPIGSGRYYFDNENGDLVLKANKSNGFSPKITTIHLENITSLDSIDNAVNIGNISFAFRDLSNYSSKKISANKKLVNMNNLVYIGLNTKNGITANPYIRKAISLAVDRSVLVKSGYGNFAQPATSVFNPQFELSQTKLFEKEADVNAAKQAISQSGESNKSLNLLVNNNNSDRVACAKLVAQQLENAGFTVTISSVTFEEYEGYVSNENFDLYIGETKIPADMNLNSFFKDGGSTRFGISPNGDVAKVYSDYQNGDCELGTFLLEFSNEMPYVPLLYRKGMVCFSKAMNGDVQSTNFDYFGNIENWYFTT